MLLHTRLTYAVETHVSQTGIIGGRAAEKIAFGEISTGASNDLENVAQIARNMIIVYGMSDSLPNYTLVNQQRKDFLGYGVSTYRRSEKIEQLVHEEIMSIIDKLLS